MTGSHERSVRLLVEYDGGPFGGWSRQSGVLTVTRAYEEPTPFLRARKQFEALLKTTVPLAHEDPYYDEKWHELKFKPNPVLDTKTYCLVKGEKVEYGQSLESSFELRKEDTTVRCWKDGKLVSYSDDVVKALKPSDFTQ